MPDKKHQTIERLKNWLAGTHCTPPELYLVGGTVRDLLLDRTPKDMDFVCHGAKEFAHKLARKKNATLVAMEKKEGEPCYRLVDRGNPKNFLDMAELRGEDILQDLARRDFTINAMAMKVRENGATAEILDPLGGIRDLDKMTLKMAGEKSLDSDPLRILRAFRFEAKLEFSIEPSTLEAITQKTALMKETSPERVMAELFMILETPRAAATFQKLDRAGALEVIFPEIKPLKTCSQNGYHHLDVWEHSLLVMQNCEELLNGFASFFGELEEAMFLNLNAPRRTTMLKLSALLHDLGKPATRDLEPETGRITFHGHDRVGAEIAEKIAERLKMSIENRKFLALMVREHLHALFLGASGVKHKTKVKWFRKMADDSIPSIILAIADMKASQGAGSIPVDREKHIARLRDSVEEYLKILKPRLERKPFISGKDILGLGMSPGPEMGRILKIVLEAQDAGELQNRHEALALAEKLVN